VNERFSYLASKKSRPGKKPAFLKNENKIMGRNLQNFAHRGICRYQKNRSKSS
jgi:hypothetical protein